MDGIENPSAELAALKAGFDELREQNADLRGEVQALKQNQPAQQPAAPTVGRRGLLAGGGVGALALLASMGGASAATDPNDGDADLGTSASPWDTYLDGLALVTEQVSTNTTVTKPVVLYDSALSSLTLTIDSSLEGPSGYSQPVVFIDRTGNADTNPVTVNDSGGSAVATIPAANSIFETWWDSGEWVTDRFIPSVDAGTVTAEDGTIGGAPILGGPSSGSSFTLNLDTWTEVDANQPTIILLQGSVQTDGTSSGRLDFEIDESGGTAADVSEVWVFADDVMGSGGFNQDFLTAYVPAGGQIRVVNSSDPNNFNTVDISRKYVVSS